jgi:hypothetical protein
VPAPTPLLAVRAFAALAVAALIVGMPGRALASKPTPLRANAWVTPTAGHGHCGRSATRVGAPAVGCATFAACYAVLEPGDVCGIAAGDYPPQQILKGSVSQTGAARTFRCVRRHACTIKGNLELGERGLGSDLNTPNHLVFDGIDIANGSLETVYNENGDPQPSGLVYEHARAWLTASSPRNPDVGAHLINLTDLKNASLVDVELGPMCCNGDAIEGGLARPGAPNDNVTLRGLYVHDVYDSCAKMPSRLKARYGCTGIGWGDGCAGCDHVDGFQTYGCHGCSIVDSTWYRAASVGCGGVIFLGPANDGSFADIRIENNFFGPTPCSNHITIGGNCHGCFSGFLDILYNTGLGKLELLGAAPRAVDFVPSARIRIVGNYFGERYFTRSYNGCSLTASDGSTLTPLLANNIWGSSPPCNATERQGGAWFVRPTIAATNLHLLTTGPGAGQWALDHGETTFCPRTDIDGDPRPRGTPCAIGADQPSRR